MKKTLIINGKNTYVFSETLLKVIKEIKIMAKENTAIAVNEVVIKKNNWKDYKIKSGDIIEIVHPLKGG
tara:strand:+ start:613 stop:819 length:207 start_codon:yes stop_codon:yes gene_type:complete